MKFTLTIELGNDAMRTFKHLAGALVQVASKLKKLSSTADAASAKILDVNGNSVGEWKLERE